MKKPRKISEKIKKQIFKKIKENIDKKKLEVTKKEFEMREKNKRLGQQEEDEEQLENLIEKTSASSFNLENFRKLALEEIIPVLKERGFQQTRPRLRNIQISGEKENQEEKIYDAPKTLAVNQTPSENYWENSDYQSSMNKNYEIKQTTPDGSSGKFVTSMQDQLNRFQTSSSASQTSSSSIGITQTAQSYESEQERKLKENRRRF